MIIRFTSQWKTLDLAIVCTRLLIWSLSAGGYAAFGSAENVFLVVNQNSWSSKAVANHYIALRRIPDHNVLHLNYRGPTDEVSLELFRKDLLGPILSEVQRRKLSDQIDYIVYSSDFPYAIDYSDRLTSELLNSGSPKIFPSASLTGLTFLQEQVHPRGTAFASLTSNEYALRAMRAGQSRSIRAFREERGLTTVGARIRHPLSTILGYTAGRGNSLGEIVSYLRRATLADCSHPQGTIFFLQHEDVRSQARSGSFPDVVGPLRKAGIDAEIVTGVVPPGGRQVAGAMLGSATVQWDSSSRILPGAICENFTSYGGILREFQEQTPLTDLLRVGATGSSGTVVEPYAIPNKFPHPILFVHYVRGCNLAESFYQSVLAPYQLLVVGDPLCRPWGISFMVQLEGVTDGQSFQGTVELRPKANVPSNVPLKDFQFFLDGRPLGNARPGESLRLNTVDHASGWHILSVVAYVAGDVRHEARYDCEVEFTNETPRVNLTVADRTAVPWGEALQIDVEGTECHRITVQSQGRILSSLNGNKGRVAVPARELSLGPVSLTALGFDAQGRLVARSAPARVQVLPPAISRGTASVSSGATVPGVLLARSDGVARLITTTAPANWLEQAGVGAKNHFSIRGNLLAREAELYQFRAEVSGTIRLMVDGKSVYSGSGESLRFGIPLHLSVGAHPFRCDVQLSDSPRAGFSFGYRGTLSLGDKNCSCTPP